MWGPGKNLSNISKHLLALHMRTQNKLEGVGWGCAVYVHVNRCVCVHKPRESLRLAHNQCLSLQDVITITQQVAVEKSLIGSHTESTINRCP